MDEKALIYQFDDVRIDPAGFRVWKGATAVQVEPKAFRVLLFLIENRGRLIEKRELLDAIWKETFVTENALTREIAQLRRALGDSAKEARYIETIPTKGYRFIADVEIENGHRAVKTSRLAETEVEQQAETEAPAHSAISVPLTGAVEETGGKQKHRWKAAHTFVLVLSSVLLTAGIFLWTYPKRPFSETRVVSRLTQVTTWPGLDIYPALSPDGNSLAYSSNHDGNFEIYVKPLASGGHEFRLTNDGSHNSEPAWSPDGQYIAYHSRNRGGIWIVAAMGGSARRLSSFGSKPVWSRDGSMLAFQSESMSDLNGGAYGALPPSTIWTIPASGGQPTRITQVGSPKGGHSSPTWSPDGKRIAFLAYDTGHAEIWSVAAGGGELRRLTTEQLFFDPVYANDGESVYCVGVSRNLFGLWRIPVARSTGEPVGQPVEVQGAGTHLIRNLSLSADGNRIAYTVRSLTSDIWSVPLSPASGESAGEAMPLFQDRSQRKTNPVISPDGKKIAFGVWRTGVPGSVWLMDADGKNPVQLTTASATGSQAGWLSNDEVTYVIYHDDKATLSATHLKTGVERSLLPLRPDMEFPRLSPDGKQLVYNSGETGTTNIWKVALDGGQPRQLTSDPELMGWASWSPDGSRLAIEVKRGDDTHIAVMPSDGGTVTQLTFERGQSWPHSWSPDGEKIAFAAFRNGVWNVWWVSVKDGTQKQLTDFDKLNVYVRYPAWSPLGNQIAFEYAEMTANVWMMELK